MIHDEQKWLERWNPLLAALGFVRVAGGFAAWAVKRGPVSLIADFQRNERGDVVDPHVIRITAHYPTGDPRGDRVVSALYSVETVQDAKSGIIDSILFGIAKDCAVRAMLFK